MMQAEERAMERSLLEDDKKVAVALGLTAADSMLSVSTFIAAFPPSPPPPLPTRQMIMVT